MSRSGCGKPTCTCAGFETNVYRPTLCKVCFHEERDHLRKGGTHSPLPTSDGVAMQGSRMKRTSTVPSLLSSSVPSSSINPRASMAQPSYAGHAQMRQPHLAAQAQAQSISLGTSPRTSYQKQISSVNTPTSSLNTPTSSLNTPTSSMNTPTSSMNTPTSSMNTQTSSMNTQTSSMNTQTSSMNTQTSSTNTPTSPPSTNHGASSSKRQTHAKTDRLIGGKVTKQSSAPSLPASKSGNRDSFSSQQGVEKSLSSLTAAMSQSMSSQSANLSSLHSQSGTSLSSRVSETSLASLISVEDVGDQQNHQAFASKQPQVQKQTRQAQPSRNDRRRSIKGTALVVPKQSPLKLKKSKGEVVSSLANVKPVFTIPVFSMLPLRRIKETDRIDTSRNSVDLTPSTEKILKFLLRSMDVDSDKIYDALEYIGNLRRNKTPLLDQDQIRHLHQIQFEVEALLSEQNMRRAVRLVEHRYRAKLERRRYLQLRQSGLIPRNLLIMDLARSEKQYIELLKNCYQHYFTPFVQNMNQTILIRANYFPDAAGMKSIFGKFDSLYYFHCDFILQFNNMTTSWPYIDGNVGGIFKKMINSFKIYEEYTNNFRHSKDTLARHEENAVFQTYLQNIVVQNPGLLPLSACLTVPLQRVSQYTKDLEMILQQTPHSHSDFADLRDVCAEMKRVNNHVQSKLERSVDRAHVLDVMRRMKDGHNNINIDSRFICEGDLSMIIDAKVHARHVFLFDDRMILVKMELGQTYRFRDMFHLSRVRFRNLPDSAHAKHLFELVYDDRTVLLSAPSLEEKSKWIEYITNILSLRVSNAVFGVPLEYLMHRDAKGQVVPTFIRDAVDIIRTTAIDLEGIFRVPGDASALERLKEQLNSGELLLFNPYSLIPNEN
eukprot:TRINITY_DN1483_c0_g1_i2.p1 TRINITY_DN1483_c0_g1~~TRINITY_DN1483_c0_g1_i2.p1  ORF type:complete len:885 (+),score=160.37 TRINITY_DN1483_c0_g1_i2:50-2704(+)